MIIDTIKLEKFVEARHLNCYECNSEKCGFCPWKKLLEACGREVPKHPQPLDTF